MPEEDKNELNIGINTGVWSLISGKEHYGVIINGSNSHNYRCIGFEKEADIKSGSGGVL